MKKVLLKDLNQFKEWQKIAIRGVDDHAKLTIVVMAPPFEYPVVLIWSIIEQQVDDGDGNHALNDKFDYKYIYVGDFPVKSIKHGTYVYQIFQTGDPSDI